MNSLELVLRNFADVFGRKGCDGIENRGLSFCGGNEAHLPDVLPSSPELNEFYSSISFDDKPVIGGSLFLEIQLVEQLVRAQEGWRYVAKVDAPKREDPSWPNEWIVFALRNGDALIADTSVEGTSIYGSVAGSSWTFKVADSLKLFLETLIDSMACEEQEFDMESLDDSYEPKSAYVARIRQIAEAHLGPDGALGVMHFFGYLPDSERDSLISVPRATRVDD